MCNIKKSSFVVNCLPINPQLIFQVPFRWMRMLDVVCTRNACIIVDEMRSFIEKVGQTDRFTITGSFCFTLFIAPLFMWGLECYKQCKKHIYLNRCINNILTSKCSHNSLLTFFLIKHRTAGLQVNYLYLILIFVFIHFVCIVYIIYIWHMYVVRYCVSILASRITYGRYTYNFFTLYSPDVSWYNAQKL